MPTFEREPNEFARLKFTESFDYKHKEERYGYSTFLPAEITTLLGLKGSLTGGGEVITEELVAQLPDVSKFFKDADEAGVLRVDWGAWLESRGIPKPEGWE